MHKPLFLEYKVVWAFLGALFFAYPAFALAFESDVLGTFECEVLENSFAVKTVYCVKELIFSVTVLYLNEVTNMMFDSGIIYAIIILNIALIGVRVATGERDPQKFTVAFLFKAGAVLLFADNFGAPVFDEAINIFGLNIPFTEGGLTDDLFQFTEQLQAVVIGPGNLFSAIFGGDSVCQYAGFDPGSAFMLSDTHAPWYYLDCILGYIFGFNDFAQGGLLGDTLLASSIFGYMGSVFFGGTIGVFIFFLGLALIIGLAMFAFRVIYVTILSYVFLGFMIALSPIFIPSILFKVTERMFDTWLKNVIYAMALPFMMMAYLAFTMPIIDTFVFDEDDDRSLRYVLTTDTEGNPRPVTESYRLPTQQCETKIASDADFFDDLGTEGMTLDIFNPEMSGHNDYCHMLNFNKVDLGEKHIQELWSMGASLLKIMVIVYLVVTVANLIPDITARLVMGGFGAAHTAQRPMLFESQIKGTIRRSASATGEAASGSSGIFGGFGGIAKAAIGAGR